MQDFSRYITITIKWLFTYFKIKSSTGNVLWNLFKLFELDEIMRQRDDLAFAESLTRFARGELNKDDLSLFRSCCFQNDSMLPQEAKNAIRLIWRNRDVDEYNVKRMNELMNVEPRPATIDFEAIDKVANGEHTKAQENKGLAIAKNLPTQKTHGLPLLLRLQINIRYMVTTNIDVSDGLFNGATGILRHFDIENGLPGSVYIEFDDKTVGKKTRAANSTWTRIDRKKETFSVTKKGNIHIIREQYPLVPAEAITIHKSQGQSLERATIQLDSGMPRSLLYVALSRATCKSGLFLVGNFEAPRRPSPNEAPLVEMNRMRTEAKLTPKFEFLRTVPHEEFQIISHNVQSLVAHYSTINKDEVYRKSSILLLQETWLKFGETDDIIIEEKIKIAQSGKPGLYRGKGTVIYKDATIQTTSTSTYFSYQDGHHIEATVCQINDIILVNVYVSNASPQGFFQEFMNGLLHSFNALNIIVSGDFNHDFKRKKDWATFLSMNHSLNLVSPLDPTTNAGTTIDAVFAKLQNYEIKTFIYESYISHHKPLVLRLKKINSNS